MTSSFAKNKKPEAIFDITSGVNIHFNIGY